MHKIQEKLQNIDTAVTHRTIYLANSCFVHTQYHGQLRSDRTLVMTSLSCYSMFMLEIVCVLLLLLLTE